MTRALVVRRWRRPLGRAGPAIAWLLAASAFSSTSSPASIERAEALLRSLESGDFAAAAGTFDETMKAALPADKLRLTWSALLAQAGKLRAIDDRRTRSGQGTTIVDLVCAFENGPLVVRVVFREDGKVTGLWFTPVDQALPKETPQGPSPPPGVLEKAVTVGKPPWELPGTLTLPRDQPCPAALLLAGSGPQDRDETIGGNKPLREIAWGLAASGIASLRYDKRTLVHGARMTPVSSITVEQEVLADAAMAIQLLRSTKGVDPSRIYVLGHSLGGTLAPLVAARDGRVNGMILMAASARPLADVADEQLAYLATLPREESGSDPAELKRLREELKRLVQGELQPEATVLGMTRAYLLDLDKRASVGVARKLAIPALLLQGGRDYQVTTQDLELWKKALGARATARLFPDLNHTFAKGKRKATPAEYARPASVDGELITEIVEWMKRHFDLQDQPLILIP